jgi:1,4-dihydroxy-2-naphthoyl-CoA hydrolase
MTDSASAFPGVPDGHAGNFVDWLGLEFVEMTGDLVVCSWTVEPRMHQPYGILHGGIHCSVVETLASLGGAKWLGDKGQVVGAMTSTATPLHRGRSQQVWVVENVATDTGKVVARGQVRLQNLYPDA